MAGGKSAAVEGKPSSDEIKLQLALAKRNGIFSRLQTIYDYTRVLDSDSDARELFICACVNITDLRTEFNEAANRYSELKLLCNPESDIETQVISSFNSFEDLYCRIKHIYNKLTSVNSTSFVDNSVHKARPRLPALEVVMFDGDIRSWPLFYANFKTVIHENDSLSNSEKMYYLLAKLSPKAQTVFSGLSPSGENYKAILDALIRRYEDKRALFTAYLNNIFDHSCSSVASVDSCEAFFDKFVSSVNAIKNLHIDNVADLIFLSVALRKIDRETARLFELAFRETEIPSFENLVSFMRDHMRILQNRDSSSVLPKAASRAPSNSNKITKAPQPQSYVTLSSSSKCLCFDITHDHLYKCPAFSSLTPIERYKHAKDLNACVSCLSVKHRTRDCHSSSSCKKCSSRSHHTALHFEKPAPDEEHAEESPAKCLVVNDPIACTSTDERGALSALDYQYVTSTTKLLPTAVVSVSDVRGKPRTLRCLLDPAAESNFITSDVCKQLGITLDRADGVNKVSGIGDVEQPIRGSATFSFSSRHEPRKKFCATALVLDRITGNLPSASVELPALPHLMNLPLADDSFSTSASVDALIGVELFSSLLLPRILKCTGLPTAIETELGYALLGSITAPRSHSSLPRVNCCVLPLDKEERSIDELLKKFWQVEESPLMNPPPQPIEDVECEHFYRVTTERDKDTGRYCVALPFKADVFSLGNSFENARRRFFSLERKLESSSELRKAYDASIREYLAKGYLSPAPRSSLDSSDPSYIIPHHAVVRDNGKFRSVLDASCKSSSGVALNDILHGGPNLQGDLFTIILNYRLFPIALSADCKQMFLQIGVRASDRRFQRILYRFSPKDSLIVYEFNRVCFGLKSSPYHALRTVKDLIEEERISLPKASEVASTSLYMDDVVFSERNVSSAVTAAHQLIQLFKRGQFDLIKWTSNSAAVMDAIPESHRSPETFEFDKPAEHKVLGLCWSQTNDCFEFYISRQTNNTNWTKRSILSEIAKLWDVMGLVAPVVLFAKLLLRELWLLKIDWNESLPSNIVDTWRKFYVDLPRLNELRIPRHIGVVDGAIVRLVGFADASQAAYGGVVYAHVTRGEDITVNLICAKSKVSPIKPQSIAKLELCASELLAKLLRRVHDTYNARYSIAAVYAFSDSKVVLCWLNGPPHRWQTFVANRVVKTTDNIPAEHFYHVAGVENPADCLSRGVEPRDFVDHPLWFRGPHWLKFNPENWPINRVDASELNDIPEEKVRTHVIVSDEGNVTWVQSLSERVSSWSRLVRAAVHVLRFARKLPRRESLSITTGDLEFAERVILRDVQQRHFIKDINLLNNGKDCSQGLIKLKPFIKGELLLVGGRLNNSLENFNRKHPIVLPRRDRVVDLLIDHCHRKYLHAGPELLLSKLREKYWILSARGVIRHRIHLCNACYRLKPSPGFTPIMSDLPQSRVMAAEKAFCQTGCDYAGPILCTPTRARGVKARKAYLCIFTCMTTRSTHIEVAYDLSTVSFVNALKRFLSRRGPVQCLYSDNATNFRGANSYLRDLYEFLDKEYRPRFQEELAENRIDWKFIAPAAPHFGGCWESTVKSVKMHLFRVIGQQILSYEELSTLLTQIECILNSRPLTVLSADPSEPTALTPAHFLHTAPLLSIPAAEVPESVSLVQRHALIDKLVQSFWKRWRNEYLHTLQTREKWNSASVPIKRGVIVLLMNDNVPPLSWPLGVVEEVFPGKDGQVRVVSVRTARGTYVRPVVKLCPLPTQ